MKRIKILLIEDNRILRDGIKALLNAQVDLNVVAVSGGHHDTLLKARTIKPQVVLIDVGLRNENGLRIVSTLARDLPQIRVIGMGLLPSQRDIVEFGESGAAGFLLKDATIEDVLRTIRSVSRGIRILPPPLAESLFTHVVEQAVQRGKGTFPDGVRMTKREREIILLIADRRSLSSPRRRLARITCSPTLWRALQAPVRTRAATR